MELHRRASDHLKALGVVVATGPSDQPERPARAGFTTPLRGWHSPRTSPEAEANTESTAHPEPTGKPVPGLLEQIQAGAGHSSGGVPKPHIPIVLHIPQIQTAAD